MSEDKVTRIVTVRCQRCESKYGRATILGELLLMPATLGGKWGWTSRRRMRDNGLAGQRTNRRDGSLRFSGGVEMKCRRCGMRTRANLTRLAELAENSDTRGSTSVLV